jgi:hypothetical protein
MDRRLGYRGAHISIIAHITHEELVCELTETERANGFANRFLFMLVRRSKALPESDGTPEGTLTPLVADLRKVMAWTQEPRRLARNGEAKKLWASVYTALSEGEPGLVGAVLGRAEAHALRLSLIYAVLDQSPDVRPEHLRAALAVWDYAEASARRIFGDALGLSAADILLGALRARGSLTRDEIRDVFQRNKTSDEIGALLGLLQEKGKARHSSRPAEGGRGRPAEVWEAVK